MACGECKVKLRVARTWESGQRMEWGVESGQWRVENRGLRMEITESSVLVVWCTHCAACVRSGSWTPIRFKLSRSLQAESFVVKV